MPKRLVLAIFTHGFTRSRARPEQIGDDNRSVIGICFSRVPPLGRGRIFYGLRDPHHDPIHLVSLC